MKNSMRQFAKKIIFLSGLFFLFPVFSQEKKSAKQIYDKALEEENVQECIAFIRSNIDFSSTQGDRRSLLYVMASLQEQLGLYNEASRNYALAAGIAAPDAAGLPKVSAEQLVIDAVRTALCAGEFETADSYLNSAVRSTKNESIRAYVNLYSVWSDLCKATSVEETAESRALLNAYITMPSMKSVKPALLLTLWYLTDEKQYADSLQKEFPYSPETGIVKGNVQVMSAPFWYFVPREEHSLTENYSSPSTDAAKAQAGKTEKNSVKSSDGKSDVPAQKTSVQKTKRQQLGLFKNEEYANDLIKKLKAKGFNGYFYKETRSSGTTYYIVVVDENKDGTMGLKLRDSGFECYEVE